MSKLLLISHFRLIELGKAILPHHISLLCLNTYSLKVTCAFTVPYKMALKGVHFLHYYRGDLAPQALNLPYSNVGDELCSTLNLPYISVGTILCSRH